jgi:hypothetical protein
VNKRIIQPEEGVKIHSMSITVFHSLVLFPSGIQYLNNVEKIKA